MILVISILLLLAYTLLFRYYAKGWNRQVTIGNSTPGITAFTSVIIAARNEEQNIPALLLSLEAQDLPKNLFEIIIVDDHSSDNTRELIMNAGIANIKLVCQDEGVSSKKKAIEKGISLSRGQIIITTDADCILPPHWLSAITNGFQNDETVFQAAPVKFSYRNNLLERFQAVDFMMLQGITASGIELDLHYMCNGANLGFLKSAFQKVHGYKGIDRIATGDDMLLMHKIKKQYPNGVRYFKNRQAIVTTTPMHSWKEFFMQRKRWASKTFVYDDWRIIGILAFVYFFNIWFFVILLTAFFSPAFIFYALVFLFIKAIVECSYLNPVAKFYNEEKLLKYLFIFQPIHVFYTVFTGAWSQVGKYEWKGRTTK
jgi:cellulose synthase/poly-beta-1,6-N-acetylglucosamine synthase-like glycosyltransferase